VLIAAFAAKFLLPERPGILILLMAAARQFEPRASSPRWPTTLRRNKPLGRSRAPLAAPARWRSMREREQSGDDSADSRRGRKSDDVLAERVSTLSCSTIPMIDLLRSPGRDDSLRARTASTISHSDAPPEEIGALGILRLLPKVRLWPVRESGRPFSVARRAASSQLEPFV